MNIMSKHNAVAYPNADGVVYEYPMGDKEINGAVAHIKGRYPEQGLAVNEVCKEMGFIMHGAGKLVANDKVTELSAGDVLIIPPGESYFFEGDLEIFVACTPAWHPEQHKFI